MSKLTVGTISGLAANEYVVDVASGSSLDITNTTGTLPSAQLPSDSILQIVNFTTTETTSTTSTNYVNTALASSITPSSASSKILILVSAASLRSLSSTVEASARLYRGDVSGTLLGSTEIGSSYSATNDTRTTFSAVYLDSPATTSSVPYTIGIRSLSPNTCELRYLQSMILMEIAG